MSSAAPSSSALPPHREMPSGLRLDVQWADITVDAATPKCEGGFAQVLRVFWNGVAYALKQPKAKISLTKRDLRDFTAEVQVQGRVRHPCCVAIFGVCLQPDDPFILMEWVGGGTVYKKLGDEELLPRVRLTCAREVASALDCLHASGIIHGDIKSMNVLFTLAGNVKVCDFGAAVQILTTVASSASGASGGNAAMTLAWCAPELFSGGSKCAATDMYAFGVFMWECLTGNVPFHRVSPSLIGDQVKSGVRPALPPVLPDAFPPDFARLLQVCAHLKLLSLLMLFSCRLNAAPVRLTLCFRSAGILTRPSDHLRAKPSAALWRWTPLPSPASRCRSTATTRQRRAICCPACLSACRRCPPSPAQRWPPCWPIWFKPHRAS